MHYGRERSPQSCGELCVVAFQAPGKRLRVSPGPPSHAPTYSEARPSSGNDLNGALAASYFVLNTLFCAWPTTMRFITYELFIRELLKHSQKWREQQEPQRTHLPTLTALSGFIPPFPPPIAYLKFQTPFLSPEVYLTAVLSTVMGPLSLTGPSYVSLFI